jgi:arsenical pump membrane protein
VSVLAPLALVAALVAAVARHRHAPEAVVAAAGAALLLGLRVIAPAAAWDEIRELAPTLGFLAALLVLGDGCERAGLFAALAGVMAARAGGSARRLLGGAVIAAAVVTAVLGLDATVVLLTPAVLEAARRARVPDRPGAYACAHLANSGSLLLPVSNLTNLLAFHAAGVSFVRFAALMALPWLVAVAVEWLVLRQFFRRDLARGEAVPARAAPRLPRAPLAVLGLTLAGFALSSPLGYDPAWPAAAAAAALLVPQLARRRARPRDVVRAVDLPLLVFVAALGVIVRAVSEGGLERTVDALLPAGGTLPALLGATALAAVLANVLNNLPALLLLLPVAAAAGPATVLAVLIGVNAGPNLTYTGSLATLLWRRVLHARGDGPSLGEFTRVGVLATVPVLAAATSALWLALRLI